MVRFNGCLNKTKKEKFNSNNASCDKCEEPLKNNTITKDDVSTVQASEDTNDRSKIKSSMC